MSLEKNKAIVRSWIEAFNKRNLALLDELVAPDFVDHNRPQGLESWKQSYTRAYKAFPDIHATIEDIIAEGDKVWVRVTDKGTHTGEYHGLAPTGKKIALTYVAIYRIVEGKIVERESVEKFFEFLNQLGIVEYKGFPEDV